MSEAVDVSDPFSTPCDLWVIPPPRMSSWFARLDWYLNWQMTRGLAYSGLHLSNELMSLAEHYEVQVPDLKVPDEPPLLVLSHARVPAKKCLVLNMRPGGLGEWLREAHDIGVKLGAEKLQIFLPAQTKVKDAKGIWAKQFSSRSAEFFADSTGDT